MCGTTRRFKTERVLCADETAATQRIESLARRAMRSTSKGYVAEFATVNDAKLRLRQRHPKTREPLGNCSGWRLEELRGATPSRRLQRELLRALTNQGGRRAR
jgi:hypothetical protein